MEIYLIICILLIFIMICLNIRQYYILDNFKSYSYNKNKEYIIIKENKENKENKELSITNKDEHIDNFLLYNTIEPDISNVNYDVIYKDIKDKNTLDFSNNNKDKDYSDIKLLSLKPKKQITDLIV